MFSSSSRLYVNEIAFSYYPIVLRFPGILQVQAKSGPAGPLVIVRYLSSVNSKIEKTGYNMSQWMSSLEDSDNSGYMWAQGNLRVITFQGKRRTHTEDEILFTLPAEHRPSMTVRCAGSYNGTSVVISLNTDGTGVLFVANGVTATGRIYFSAAFMH